MKSRIFTSTLLLLGILILASCGKDAENTNPLAPAGVAPKDTGKVAPVVPPPAPPAVITLGDIRVKRQDFTNVLLCQTEIATSQHDASGGALNNFGPVLLTLGGRDLDPDALNDLVLSFDHGVYEADYGHDRVRMVFYFAQASGTFRAGDTVPYHLFAINSYVRNVTISWTGIHYDRGPLFDLIRGDVRFNGLNPEITLGSEDLLVSVEYAGVRVKSYPDNETDTLQLFLRTDRANVQYLADQLKGAGFMFNVDSSRYSSPHFNTYAVIDTSRCNVRKKDDRFIADGTFSGRILQNGISYYFEASFSSDGDITTGFYMTPDMGHLAGTACYSGDRHSGTFTTAGGDTLSFRLP